MAEFILECDCGSHMFTYDDNLNRFKCTHCGKEFYAEDAGNHLVSIEDLDEDPE